MTVYRTLAAEEHHRRHHFLHRCLDELIADFISQTKANLSDTTIFELIKWSYNQTGIDGRHIHHEDSS